MRPPIHPVFCVFELYLMGVVSGIVVTILIAASRPWYAFGALLLGFVSYLLVAFFQFERYDHD